MSVTEIGPQTWRIESLIGPRRLFQYVVVGSEGDALLVDCGTAETPRDVILPALRHVGVSADAVRWVVVTHPDLDHQGGLAVLRDALPRAVLACGFADRGLVADPARLLSDRYGAYEDPHDVGYPESEKAWIRSLYGAPARIDVTFAGGEQVELGERVVALHHAPGHSAGHLVVHDRGAGLLFTSDAVHWRFCPAADGTAALPPTYEDVDAYLDTIALVESLAPAGLHSGHWPELTAGEVASFCRESRETVVAIDRAVTDRLGSPATLRALCDHVDATVGPFGADPVNLMFAVHGHLRRLLRRGTVRCLDPAARPPSYVCVP